MILIFTIVESIFLLGNLCLKRAFLSVEFPYFCETTFLGIGFLGITFLGITFLGIGFLGIGFLGTGSSSWEEYSEYSSV